MFQMSNEKKTGCLGYIGDYTGPRYVGIFLIHKKSLVQYH